MRLENNPIKFRWKWEYCETMKRNNSNFSEKKSENEVSHSGLNEPVNQQKRVQEKWECSQFSHKILTFQIFPPLSQKIHSKPPHS
jgi:hypothetical protein